MPLGDIMKNPEMKAIVLKYLPEIEAHPSYSMGLSYSLGDIKTAVDFSTQSAIDKIVAELKELE